MATEFKKDNAIKLVFEKTGQALHGDVVIEKINNLPENFESLPSDQEPVLAYGEVTGHSHRMFRMTEGSDLPGVVLKTGTDGVKFLHVIEPVVLRHQEHDPRIISPGFYKIGIQREYDPFTKLIRQVAD